MNSEPHLQIEITPDMAEMIERMRGRLSPQDFLRVLLSIADSGAVRSTPQEVKNLPPKKIGMFPLLTPEEAEACQTEEDVEALLRDKIDEEPPA